MLCINVYFDGKSSQRSPSSTSTHICWAGIPCVEAGDVMVRSFDPQGRQILKQAALISRSSLLERTSTEHRGEEVQARKDRISPTGQRGVGQWAAGLAKQWRGMAKSTEARQGSTEAECGGGLGAHCENCFTRRK